MASNLTIIVAAIFAAAVFFALGNWTNSDDGAARAPRTSCEAAATC